MVKKIFHRLLAEAGIRRIRLYDLPHTAATMGVAAGVSVKAISDQLGHSSISFTLERYSHVLPSIQDEAAARVERMLMGVASTAAVSTSPGEMIRPIASSA
jgi:integrase